MGRALPAHSYEAQVKKWMTRPANSYSGIVTRGHGISVSVRFPTFSRRRQRCHLDGRPILQRTMRADFVVIHRARRRGRAARQLSRRTHAVHALVAKSTIEDLNERVSTGLPARRARNALAHRGQHLGEAESRAAYASTLSLLEIACAELPIPLKGLDLADHTLIGPLRSTGGKPHRTDTVDADPEAARRGGA